MLAKSTFLALGLACGAGLAPRVAAAACDPTVASLSEARAARFLIGDDLRLQSSVDDERWELRQAAAMGGAKPTFHVFGAASGGYQAVLGLQACTNLGTKSAALNRIRATGSVGFTHEPTGLHARVSYVFGSDSLQAGGNSQANEKGTTDASVGYRQSLVALRLGHELWLQGIVGYVTGEEPYRTKGSGGVQLAPRLPASPAPGYYLGATSPLLHTSIVSLLQHGKPEVVSVLASDLRLGPLPFGASIGPTYIREERQVVGLLRLRGYTDLLDTRPRADSSRNGKSRVHGVGERLGNSGPTLEGSLETHDPRLRHARFRYQYGRAYRFGAPGRGESYTWSFDAYGEGTVFRSRFFSESRDVVGEGVRGPVQGPLRGNAWGGGAGATLSVQAGWIGLTADAYAGINRPELLGLIPSAANHPELRATVGARLEY